MEFRDVPEIGHYHRSSNKIVLKPGADLISEKNPALLLTITNNSFVSRIQNSFISSQ